jgi:hypothetical protein
VENGEQLFLWVGRQVSPAFINAVLGAASFQSIDLQMVWCSCFVVVFFVGFLGGFSYAAHAPQTELPVAANALSEQVRGIVTALRTARPPFMKMTIVKQKDPLELLFLRHLPEDKVLFVCLYGFFFFSAAHLRLCFPVERDSQLC